jgi:hypothetical protein
MMKQSDLGPPIPGKLHGRYPTSATNNCPSCGQMVDMRDLRQVIWHEETKHKPRLLLLD